MRFEVNSAQAAELVDITRPIEDAIVAAGARAGLCNVFIPHTTAAVIVSENWDPDVTSDLLDHLQKLVPRQADYRHSEGNSQAHILSVMLGTSLNLPISEGKLALGRWQGVMLAEFDGPRRRQVVVTLLAGAD